MHTLLQSNSINTEAVYKKLVKIQLKFDSIVAVLRFENLAKVNCVQKSKVRSQKSLILTSATASKASKVVERAQRAQVGEANSSSALPLARHEAIAQSSEDSINEKSFVGFPHK